MSVAFDPARIPDEGEFRRRSWWRAFGNFSLIRHRATRGHLVSMHQSGTHWLKYMLANALSHHYGTPPPEYNHANDIIGGPRDEPRHPGLPRLVSSHSIPHPLLRLPLAHRGLALPPYVVLVRDVRDSLESNFEKWRDRYATSFHDYLAGDPFGRRFNSDLWWAIRFLNAWGAVRMRVPDRVTVVRYEALQADAAKELARVNAAFGLGLPEDALAHGVAVSSRDAMLAKDDPGRPPGAVRNGNERRGSLFDDEARAFLETICARFLAHDFGYDYRSPATPS